MRQVQKTTLSVAAAQVALLWCGGALAQSPAPAPTAAAAPAGAAEPPAEGSSTIVVKGQRAALQSAQKIKQESDEIVDSIVADDIGKLPDRSVTEVLQRIVGVTIDRTMAKNDPEHYSVEGSGVNIRGLTWVRSELNGRDSFSANGGRSLNFEDVPPELMAGVDVYKNPSAEQTEGAIGGLVNLRTALPFDYQGFKGAVSLQSTYSALREKFSPSGSVLLSNTWATDFGKFGALIDLAYSESATRNDKIQVEPYYPRTDIVDGQTVWVPKGAQWRSEEFDRTRQGSYGALQWKLGDLESSLTLFRSDYQMDWMENALFAQSNAYNITVDEGATWGPNGNLVRGTMRAPADGGINFGADTRVMTRESATQDIGWNLKWKASEQWSFSTDLQYIRATTSSFDSTVATGVRMAKETIDLSGELPRLVFDDEDRAILADPANYYWGSTMEHFEQSKGTEKAWRGDAKFKFDDPVLVDLRFGLRLTDRDAHTVNTGYNWAAVTQPWMAWWYLAPGSLAYLNDPRFSSGAQLHSFDNFFNRGSSMPSLIMPDKSVAAGYPDSYATLHGYSKTLCEEWNGDGSGACFNFWNARDPNNPQYQNQQREQTQAAYTQLRFAFDDWQYPVDGNVGLRVVNTRNKAQGYMVFVPASNVPDGATGVPVPRMSALSESRDYEHDYVNVLPSLNLRMKAGKDLQFRFGYATGISRPDFSNMQAYSSLTQTADVTTLPDGTTRVNSVSHTGEAFGNPLLKPVRSQQADVTAEWYFGRTDSITVAAFYKDLKDIIIKQTSVVQLPDNSGNPVDFVVTSPINGAKGHAAGFEVAYQQYFDMLPDWMSGFGLQANYTFVDSKRRLYDPVYSPYCSGGNTAANVNLNLNGCDTDGRTFGNLPIEGLSRHAYNLALMYDKGPWSARLAYSWRSKYLQAVNANGTNGTDGTDTNPDSPTVGQHNVAWALPTWQDAYGQVDAGIYYKWDDNLQVGLDAQNLTDSVNKQLMQQHIGMMGRAWNANGPRYTVTLRYTF
ncbi:MAG TPA: TonB-dependent receptor [Ideonella sp.]|uniref:TonB-dependent receptor n=1 Tax=Ideonella sp. TaxID=1929293 RepID=UPI002E331773|nr:TonB-dependent receptor [Ideonella sp.]HEX5685542.1 TonB-dependent receptor [Ideonella sp.]